MKKKTKPIFLSKIILPSLFCFILILAGLSAKSQTISGDIGVCIGESRLYQIINPLQGINYSWIITPAGLHSVFVQPNNEAIIQWGESSIPNYFTIEISDGSTTVASLNVYVYEKPNPFITTDNIVGCQSERTEGENLTTFIMDDKNGCINVCANSVVTYKVHGQLIYGQFFWNKYDWNITGGVFLPSNTTSLQGGFYQGFPYVTPNLNEEVTVYWGQVGTGYLTVTETSILPCNTPQSKTICINIIESPKAEFTFDDLNSPTNEGDCYDVCQNSKVHFKNLSVSSKEYPIIHYQWDFGDNSPYSHLENPSHIYNTPGNYEVTLTVTNNCGCVSVFIREICVDEHEAPHIACPNIVCENHTDVYWSDSQCSPYDWSVQGGTILSQNNHEVEIRWDNVGNDGFGFVMLDGSTCENTCPLITKLKVPVIKQLGVIDGPQNVCVDKQYLYKLPAWPATNFEWEIINNTNGAVGATFLTNSHEFSVVTGVTVGSFTVRCRYFNTLITDCAGQAEITVNVQPTPLLDAPEESCINSNVICNIASSLVPFIPFQVSGVTSFTVYKPDGSTANASTAINSNTITLSSSIFNIPGKYMITASNPPEFCDPEPIMLRVLDVPPAPTVINGSTEVCLTDPYTYSTDYLQGTSIKWTVSGGYIAGCPSCTTGTGLNISVIWTSTGTKTITAQRFWDNLPDCLSDDFNININHIVINGAITGEANPCEDSVEEYEIDTYGIVPDVISWSLHPANLGSITDGQGTDKIEITWLHLGAQQNCQIRCELTKCGIKSAPIVYNVAIQGSTSITSISPTGPFCSGEAISSFQVNTTGAAASSFIWDMGDGYTTTTSGNTLTYTYYNTSNSSAVIYPFTVTAISSCNGNPSLPYTTNITVNPEPNASISPAGNVLFCPPMGTYQLNISNTSSGTFSYQWYFVEYGTSTDKQISGANGQTYTVSSTLPNVSPAASTSQGTYYAVVINTTTGCAKTTNGVTISEDPNCGGGGGGGCTPQSPAGISNFSVSLIDCATIQASCNTAGTLGGNIISYNWSVISGGVSYTQSGTPTQNLSPEYTFSKPGQYAILLDVLYENDDLGQPPCLRSKTSSFIVPMVADMRWGFQCNGTNNGYDLLFYDNTTVFPGNPVTQWQWLLNGSPVCTTATCTIAVTTSASYTLELIVGNGTAHACTTAANITVPDLPIADFYMTTTHPVSNSQTCENREVEFTNTSTPAADILSTVWEFISYPPAKSYLYHTAFTYVYDQNTLQHQPSLTVTNKYGCTNTKALPLTVYNNSLSFSQQLNQQYTPLTYNICQGSTTANVFSPIFSGGNSPLSYQWYTGANQLAGLTSATLNITSAAQYGSGTYWVKVTDVNNCYKEINPTPAKLSIIYAPTAIIDGKPDVCKGDAIVLTAITGFDPSTVSYDWSYTNPNSQTIGPYTTKEISIPSDYIGVYTFMLTVTDNSGTNCSSTSYPFPVTVHALPASPVINLSVLDCDKYELELTATSGITPTPVFNWSNGAPGSSITVYHGGVYRAWLTDEHGCRSHADINIPLAPNTYFWRFPQDGCYNFCPEDLERWIWGPDYVIFENWSWYKDGNPVNNNNPYNGSGSASVCDPLRIDVQGDGEGPGEYFWELDNDLCMQQSRPMSWLLLECCRVEVDVEYVECIELLTYEIGLNVDVYTNNCPNPSYNISVIDPSTGLAIGSFSSVSPQNLQQGGNQINGIFHLLYHVPFVEVRITVFCGSQEKCTGVIDFDIPACEQSRKGYAYEAEKPVADKVVLSEMHIFPNPSTTQTNIVYRLASEKLTSGTMLRIVDVSGRVIETIPLHQKTGRYIYNTGKLLPGIYLVELIENNRRTLTKRIMIVE